MSIENPQTIAHERLVTLAQERALIIDNPEEIQNLVSAFARAILAAIHVGLTPNEIRAACREGTDTKSHTLLDPSLDPEYWLIVYAEAVAFWEERSGCGGDRVHAD